MPTHPLLAFPIGGSPAAGAVFVEPAVAALVLAGFVALACAALWMLHRLDHRPPAPPKDEAAIRYRKAA